MGLTIVIAGLLIALVPFVAAIVVFFVLAVQAALAGSWAAGVVACLVGGVAISGVGILIEERSR